MKNRIGRQSLLFRNRPVISGAYSIAGKKEGEGPLNKDFDFILPKDDYGEKTWEKAESKMLKKAIEEAIVKSGHRKNEIDAVLSGDLLNQLMSSSFMARDLHIPFLGLYGALLDNGGVAASWQRAGRRRLCFKRDGRSIKSLLYGGKTVSYAS